MSGFHVNLSTQAKNCRLVSLKHGPVDLTGQMLVDQFNDLKSEYSTLIETEAFEADLKILSIIVDMLVADLNHKTAYKFLGDHINMCICCTVDCFIVVNFGSHEICRVVVRIYADEESTINIISHGRRLVAEIPLKDPGCFNKAVKTTLGLILNGSMIIKEQNSAY